MQDVVVLGGGIAGLSAAIHCSQAGAKVLLIEKNSYPAHKICGEFLSPECLPLLKEWNLVPSVLLRTITITAGQQKLSFTLPRAAGSWSRFVFDNALACFASDAGVTVQSGSTVKSIDYEPSWDGYCIGLTSGKQIKSPRIIIGTGRISQLLEPEQKNEPLQPQFVGMKAHFSGVDVEDCVHFFIVPGGYLGISSIEDGKTNLACLATPEAVAKHGSAEQFMQHVLSLPEINSIMAKAKRLFPQWLTCSVPRFGMQQMVRLKNIFCIGDAAAVIPPATGDGLAIGLTSGRLVAPFVLSNDSEGFYQAWHETYVGVLRNGLMLHQLMLHPWFTRSALNLGQYIPNLAQAIFMATRCKN